jgi:hypothetical protein
MYVSVGQGLRPFVNRCGERSVDQLLDPEVDYRRTVDQKTKLSAASVLHVTYID